MHSANPHTFLLGCVGILGLLTAPLALPACGVNDTSTPAQAEYYPLPPEAAIKGEFFIAVRPEPNEPRAMEIGPIAFVREHIECLYRMAAGAKNCNDSSSPVSIIGCGGTTDRSAYEYSSSNLFCVRLPNPETDIISLLRNPQIRYIEAHGYVVPTGLQVCPSSWGLDQIDQAPSERRNGVYAYQYTGKGVHVWVVDSGMTYDSKEFQVPFGTGIYADNVKYDETKSTDDDDGHGTQIGGLVGGKFVGVAKNAILHPVKVVRDMKTSLSSVNAVLRAITYFREKQCKDPKKDRVPNPSIVVLPFTTDTAKSGTLDDEVNRLIDCDFVVITGAGNTSEDAGKYSPASVDRVITVGAFDQSGHFAAFSNYGKSVDLLAPGDNITSIIPELLKGSVSNIIAGTSASAAFAAGVAAQILEANFDDITKKGVKSVPLVTNTLLSHSKTGILELPSNTADHALHSPYGTGETGKPSDQDADGCSDAVSFLACPSNGPCDMTGFCGGIGGCCNGIEDPLSSLQCGRGVSCKEGKCRSCGLTDEPCCSGKICGGSLTCDKGICVCGGKDQPCCGGTACGDALSCSGGLCVSCGGPKEPCCGAGMCDASTSPRPLVCAHSPTGDTCEQCGLANGDWCCEKGDCPGPNLLCGSDGKCASCGAAGQRCCGGDACNVGVNPLVCLRATVGDTCQPCGLKADEPCCDGGTCPGRDLVCDGDLVGGSGQCKPCGGKNQVCCDSANRCIGDLECVDHERAPEHGGKKCEGGGSCSVRCTNGELLLLDRQANATSCECEGNIACTAVACGGTSNHLARARYKTVATYEDRARCGDLGQACCQEDDLTGRCDKGTCKVKTPPMGSCTNGPMYTCQ